MGLRNYFRYEPYIKNNTPITLKSLTVTCYPGGDGQLVTHIARHCQQNQWVQGYPTLAHDPPTSPGVTRVEMRGILGWVGVDLWRIGTLSPVNLVYGRAAPCDFPVSLGHQ
jgi:hypothetical protein